MNFNVTADMKPQLKKLWAAGLSALECGQELGLAGEPSEVREAVLRAVEAETRPTAKRPAGTTGRRPGAQSIAADSWWTNERIATLKKLHTEGLSTSLIAKEMGATSRSAVLGKLRRLGLANGSYPTATIRPPQSRPKQPRSNLPKRYHARVIDNSDADPRFATDGITGQPDVLDLEIPVAQRRSMLGPPNSQYPERGPRDCAWPVGEPKDPAFFFCGAARSGDEPYCAFHCRRAYNGAMSRRRAA